ncbi:MAG: hypothetical protein V3U52_06995 [Thermoplasmata archaeon]
MKEDIGLERIGNGSMKPKSEIKVVDLSKTAPRQKGLTPLHNTILAALRRAFAGIMSRDDLLEMTRDYSFSEVERALRYLSLEGWVKLLWRSPFRFMAFLTESGRRQDPWATPLPRGLSG